MKTIEFFIPCNPPKHTAQGSNRIMKRKDGTMFVGKFATSLGKQTEGDLISLLMPHRPATPLTESVSIEILWAYPYRKSEKKSIIREGADIPCTTKPDLDNLCKMVLDVMTRIGFWNDDSQVSSLHIKKVWSANAGIQMRISG